MRSFRRKLLIGSCLFVSFAVHLMFLSAFGKLGALDFGKPVSSVQHVEVDLKSIAQPPNKFTKIKPQNPAVMPQSNKVTESSPQSVPKPFIPAKTATAISATEPEITRNTTEQPAKISTNISEKSWADEIKTTKPVQKAVLAPDPPLRSTGEFLGSHHEKLVYRVSLLGMPVGSAELEAKNVNGEVWITLRVKSDLALSTIYPVDDLIETRHIHGNYILTRIRQQEGFFRGDRGFTLFLRDKNVFWIDRLTNRSVKESLPNSDVVDILSGLYFLRNRELKIGAKELLHIYDSDTYSEVPVDVIRKENVTLPAFRNVDAVLIQPQLKSEGIFKRNGDILIWLSDDQYKVPVKVVTSIALGRVTAELVSAETNPVDNSVVK